MSAEDTFADPRPSPDASWMPYYRSPRFVRVAGTRLRYIDAGEGPTVVLIHGMAHSVIAWRYQIPALVESGHRVLAIDSPGFGDSEAIEIPPGQGALAHLASFMHQLFQTFCLEDFHLVGHSLGGMYAAAYAIHHREHLRSLVLVAPANVGPRIGLGVRLLSLRPLRRLPVFAPPRPAFDRGFARLFHTRDVAREEADLEFQAFRRWITRPGSGRWMLELVGRGLRLRGLKPEYQLLDRLRALQLPVLVVWGRHDRVVPVSNATLIAEALPQARSQILENSGHLVLLEEPAAVNRLLLDFFAEVDPMPADP